MGSLRIAEPDVGPGPLRQVRPRQELQAGVEADRAPRLPGPGRGDGGSDDGLVGGRGRRPGFRNRTRWRASRRATRRTLASPCSRRIVQVALPAAEILPGRDLGGPLVDRARGREDRAAGPACRPDGPPSAPAWEVAGEPSIPAVLRVRPGRRVSWQTHAAPAPKPPGDLTGGPTGAGRSTTLTESAGVGASLRRRCRLILPPRRPDLTRSVHRAAAGSGPRWPFPPSGPSARPRTCRAAPPRAAGNKAGAPPRRG